MLTRLYGCILLIIEVFMVMPWKIFQKQLILFAPASSSAVVIRFWIVTWKVALFPCREASLMMMVVSSSSQSYTSDAKPENWSDSFIRSSFFCCITNLVLGRWVILTWHYGFHYLFTEGSVKIGFSCWLYDFFLRLYLPLFSPESI